MHSFLALRYPALALLCGLSFAVAQGQARDAQPTAGCPAQPSTLRAMHNCYRPLLVFAPSLDNAQAVAQFNLLKTAPAELRERDMMYVPVVPEGHNQPIPGSHIPTARLSEDELAATRLRFKVEPAEFMVILIGKDGGEKLKSETPVTMEKIKALIDSMPMRQEEMERTREGEE